MATVLSVRADGADARDFRPNCQTTLRCFISDLTEHDHFDLKTPSFWGILLSASSAVKLRWSRTGGGFLQESPGEAKQVEAMPSS
jgi:hypothetical protein